MAATSKKRTRAPLAAAPPPHAPGAPPRTGVPAPRAGLPLGYVPRRSPQSPPPNHPPPAGTVPNPRTPKLVRDVHRGTLNDLFVLFPDLPRPPRPSRSPRAGERTAHRRRRDHRRILSGGRGT